MRSFPVAIDLTVIGAITMSGDATFHVFEWMLNGCLWLNVVWRVGAMDGYMDR